MSFETITKRFKKKVRAETEQKPGQCLETRGGSLAGFHLRMVNESAPESDQAQHSGALIFWGWRQENQEPKDIFLLCIEFEVNPGYMKSCCGK